MVGWSQDRPLGTCAVKTGWGVCPLPQASQGVCPVSWKWPCSESLWMANWSANLCSDLFPWLSACFPLVSSKLTGQAHPCTAIVTAHWQTSDPAGPDNGKLLIFVGSTKLKWTTDVMSSIVLDSDNPGEKSFRNFLTMVFPNLAENM